MGEHTHYDQEDVKVRYAVQRGKCACGSPLFPTFHVAMANPDVEPHPCNLVLLCHYCGGDHESEQQE